MFSAARFRSHGWFGGWTVGCLLVLTASFLLWRQTGGKTDRIIRVGADNAAPYYTVQPDGSVKGLAVDILNEAARRRGIRLQWIGVTDMSLDQALFSRRVDLWPAVGSTEERLSKLHFTEPWLQARYCLISRAGATINTQSDAVGKRISHVPYPNTIRLAKKGLPGANLVPSSSHMEVVRAVCLGEADAGFLDSRILDSVLLHRPPGCESTDFHLRFLQGAGHPLSIVTQKSLGNAGDALRAEISRMALDGTFAASLDQWSSFSAEQTRSLFALREAEALTRVQIYAMCCLGVAALLLCWQIQKRRKTEKLLESLAKQDPLTGLANRRYFETGVERAIAEARSTRQLFALFYLDVDGFKVVNDSLGHAAGDALLCEIAKRLKDAVRSCDQLARIGGDEFTIVTGSLSSRDAVEELAKRILATFDESFAIPGKEVCVGASIGISLYPDDGSDVAALQLNADTAMYITKKNGRNGFSFFGDHPFCPTPLLQAEGAQFARV